MKNYSETYLIIKKLDSFAPKLEDFYNESFNEFIKYIEALEYYKENMIYGVHKCKLRRCVRSQAIVFNRVIEENKQKIIKSIRWI